MKMTVDELKERLVRRRQLQHTPSSEEFDAMIGFLDDMQKCGRTRLTASSPQKNEIETAAQALLYTAVTQVVVEGLIHDFGDRVLVKRNRLDDLKRAYLAKFGDDGQGRKW